MSMQILKIDTEKRRLGSFGEKRAVRYLRWRGYRILKRNFVTDQNEIDIIARRNKTTVFVEVKTRRQLPDTKTLYGRPASAVNYTKKQNLISAARRYLYENKSSTSHLQPRIDIIEVYVDPKSDVYKVLDVRHFPNAVHR